MTEIPAVDWRSVATPEEFQAIENALARIKEAEGVIEFNLRIVKSFTMQIEMAMGRKLLGGKKALENHP